MRDAVGLWLSGRMLCQCVHAVDRHHQVRDSYAESDRTLVLGGDHSISIGSVSGVLQSNPEAGVIWVDAHCDINTPSSSQSKNVHGMVLAFLMKLFPQSNAQSPFSWMDEVPALPPSQVVFIGPRSIDKAERDLLRASGMHVYTMASIDKHGIGAVVETALDKLGDRDIHLSYDIDGLDPSIAPSTGTPVQGGLSYREAHFIAEEVGTTGRLRSMDIVEVDPLHSDVNSHDRQKTVELAAGLVASAFGESIL